MNRQSRRALAMTTTGFLIASSLATAIPAQGSASAPTAGALTPPCVSDPIELSYEEILVNEPAPRELIADSGLDSFVASFAEELCSSTGTDELSSLIERRSRELWKRGIDAGRAMAGGDVPDADDRPLYWARLAMTGALRQWAVEQQIPDETLNAQLSTIDTLSRGQDSLNPDATNRDVVVLTGFDPFNLHFEPRISNPSGATVLALDGVVVEGPEGPVEIQAALFPVRWTDFGDGMVEKALTPAFSAEKEPQLFFTISQGSPSQFDLEAFNGAWRGGSKDNAGECYQGMVPIPNGIATVQPQPQWTESTLPRGEMVEEVNDRPFTVNDNHSVVEATSDTPASAPRVDCPADSALNRGESRSEGPTEGSVARQGGGGNYLSNEVAYRATLLRGALDLDDLPGGHVHTPVLEGLGFSVTELSNPEFVTNRRNIIAQTKKLVESALANSPRVEPTDEPTGQPTNEPTDEPTDEPTASETDDPTGSSSAVDSSSSGTVSDQGDGSRDAGGASDSSRDNANPFAASTNDADADRAGDEEARSDALPQTGGIPMTAAIAGGLLVVAGATIVFAGRRRELR